MKELVFLLVGVCVGALVSACAAPTTGQLPTTAPALTAALQSTPTEPPPTTTRTAEPPAATSTTAPPTAAPTAEPPMATSAPVATMPASPGAPSPTVDATSSEKDVYKIILNASVKNQNLTSYRGESTLRITDDAPAVWKGEAVIPDVHYTYSKGTEQQEMITIGNDFYLKNAQSPDEWFLLPEAEHATYIQQSPRSSIQGFTGFFGDFSDAETAILGSYRNTATEELDGMTCDVYTQSKPAAAATFFNLWTGKNHLVPPSEEMAALFEVAETKLWLCADGYVHQLQAAFQLKAESSAGSGSPRMEVAAHIYDLNADIQLVAPTNVKPFTTSTP